MTPSFACFPTVTFFFALFVLAAILLLAGIGKAGPGGRAEPADPRPINRPAWWVLVLIPVALAVVMGLLAWSTADY